ncbi:MAG: MgtC/SapB family protein [Proteobacteria bacterium]|nr:MgtC/SapB family protein [Pseudomonadota bacterium]MBU4297105.1 MgtC/SapB family protein [Pseudomonadota bacterium]
MDIMSADFWKCIGTAVLCGAIIGFERQLRGKPAGIRTSILICLGTALFISLGIEFSNENTDMTRVLGQVVTGIGFLGAGVILAREGIVMGVTSAAVIWVLAGVGAMIGFNKITEAIVVTLLTVILLTGITFLEGRIKSLRRGVHAQSPTDDKSEG